MEPGKPEIRDLQANPLVPFVMIPKVFFELKPSQKAILAFVAIRFYAREGRSVHVSVPAMARRAALSVDGFRSGVAELVKLKVLRVRRQSKKTAKGNRVNLPNLYELLDLQPPPPSI